jgi:hypothetical protein
MVSRFVARAEMIPPKIATQIAVRFIFAVIFSARRNCQIAVFLQSG